MDFFNNQIGRNIGGNLSFYSTPALVESTILLAIYNGQLVYLTPLTNEHEILPTTQIKPTNQ